VLCTRPEMLVFIISQGVRASQGSMFAPELRHLLGRACRIGRRRERQPADDDAPTLLISSYGNDQLEREGVGCENFAGPTLPCRPADYLEGTVQDGDFWVDAAIASPGAELEAKREAA
jgi:hypothetical protein